MDFYNSLYNKRFQKKIPYICIGSSYLIAAFGQPAWSPLMGVFSSIFAYALFWQGLFYFPSRKIKFLISTLWFAAAQMIQLSWMLSLQFQDIFIVVVYLFVTIMMGLQFGVLNLFLKKGTDLTFKRIVFIAGFWVLMEWCRLWFLCGFPFNPIGISLSSTLQSRQVASLFGVYGMSFWVMLTNLIAFKCFQKRSGFVSFQLTFFAIFPHLFGFGHIQYHKIQKEKQNVASLRALLVQTAIYPPQKTGFKDPSCMIDPLNQWESIFKYLSMHQDKSVDLIVFPENTIPFAYNRLIYSQASISDLAKKYFGSKSLEDFFDTDEEYVDNAYVSKLISKIFSCKTLIGLEYIEGLRNGDSKSFASALCFEGEDIKVYHKRVLLPLVECLPFEWCRPIAEQYGLKGWFEPGKKSEVFEGKIKVSPSICMEELFPHLSRESRILGANVLVNLTNDAWYPHSQLSKQHFHHGLLRAVENGVPLLRACNTGITAAIDALGNPIAIYRDSTGSTEKAQGAFFVEIPTYQYKTFYTKFGESLIVYICFCFFYLHFIVWGRISFERNINGSATFWSTLSNEGAPKGRHWHI